jgi:bisanhydrobacterioruberin hydratase
MRLADFILPASRSGADDIRRPGRRVAMAATVLLALVTAACCLPFFARPVVEWTEMNPWLLAITAASTMAAFIHASLSLSVQRAALLAFLAFAVSLAAEYSGTLWHLPFGYQYSYNSALEPRFGGLVPVCVPLLWFVLSYAPVVFLRRMRVRAAGRLNPIRFLVKVGLCSLYLVATDLVLDPLGVWSGAWTWTEAGPYYGTPLLNFAGWMLVGTAIFAPYFALAGEDPPAARPSRLDGGFMAVSLILTLLCMTACVLHLGAWLPVTLAGAMMVPIWIWWLADMLASRARAAHVKDQS